jgi:4-amino-4-deoxy-L-arabinose transferase-like glycosyltransferase
VVAAPWYALVTWRNGWPFLEDFFVKHHFGRLAASALGHEQPFWFYVPVLLAGLFPWTPFLTLLVQKEPYQDRRIAFLLAWAVWGLVFGALDRMPARCVAVLSSASL